MSTAASQTESLISGLKSALRKMPSPVAIVSATDPSTLQPRGLAVTAYMPVSMDPPSMQVCINQSASAYGAILAAGTFAINVLGLAAAPILQSFADPAKKDDRFAARDWQLHGSVPYMPDAASAIFCRIAELHEFGTHTAVIALVEDVFQNAAHAPAVWLDSRLCSVEVFDTCR